MKIKFILSFLLLTILSTTIFAQTTSVPVPVSLKQAPLDRTIYDENGFLLKQPGRPKNFPDIDLSKKNNIPIEIGTTTNNTDIPKLLDSSDIKQGEFASCFDYYKFGSINVSMSTDFPSYQAGGLPVIINGDIKNNNKYPVVGLDIKARLVKNIPSPDYFRAEVIILDDFDIASDITIKAGGVYKIPSYALMLPANAPAGEYQIFFYAVEKDRFNLAGLSFTNDVVASKVNFTLTGKNKDHIYLDQTKITVGGQPHNIMSFLTQHKSGVQIPIKIPLNNPSDIDEDMTVTYDLYSWDAANPANKISTKVEKVKVPAKSSVNLTYTIDKGVIPVYYLTITAEQTNPIKHKSVFSEKTISNIRLAVEYLPKPRINFTGIDSFPLKKGVESTLFTCFHNTNNSVDLNKTKIETVLYDQNNKELSRIEYGGKIVPDISGLIRKFTPNKDFKNFSIVTKMFDDKGNELDSIEKKYNCEDIDPTVCDKKKTIPYLMMGISTLGIVIVIVLFVWIYKRKINRLKK